jgi:hypothetical protein
VPVPVPYANLTNPQTLNLYSMVSDDPESFADLDGHEAEQEKAQQPPPPPPAQKTYQVSYGGTTVEALNNNTATVTSTQTTMTAPSNGDGPVTWTTTSTTATYSSGDFKGATTTTTNTTLGTDGRTTSSSVSSKISYGQAAGTIGANNLAQGREASLPSFAAQLGNQVSRDFKRDPVKYVGTTAGVVAKTCPNPVCKAAAGAVAGAATAYEAYKAWKEHPAPLP